MLLGVIAKIIVITLYYISLRVIRRFSLVAPTYNVVLTLLFLVLGSKRTIYIL
jgi:hypothetical protein